MNELNNITIIRVIVILYRRYASKNE